MGKERFSIPPRRFRGETAVVTSRLPVELISLLDNLSRQTGRSRNEVIQLCLEYAIDNMDDRGSGESSQWKNTLTELDGVRCLVEQVKAKLALLPGEKSVGLATLDALLDDLKFSMLGTSKTVTPEIDDRLSCLADRMASEMDNLIDIHSCDIGRIEEICAEMRTLIQERNGLRKS